MIDKFKKLENKYNVENIYYKGEQVWSFLRINYYWESISDRSEKYLNNKKLNIIKKVLLKLSTIFYGFPSWFKRYDYLVFSDIGERVKIDSKYVDKSFDKIIEFDTDSTYL